MAERVIAKSGALYLLLAAAVGIVATVWLFSPVPALVARFVWDNYRAAPLAIILDRSDAELAMAIGNYNFNTLRNGVYDLGIAQKAFARAVAIDPGILWGHYQLARVYFVKGDFEKALSEINEELRANPENLRSLYIRGLIYGYRGEPGDLARAEADFRKFTQWAPSEWAGYNDLAWVLLEQGKYKEAKQALKNALAKASHAETNPWLWNQLGVAELNLNEHEFSAASFEKAQDLAEKLTLEEWRAAYPGNDPRAASGGLESFRSAIAENLRRASPVD